ncbi:hypothetical protein CY35_02G028800 [Sphagnum magellanicum]|nr:hypothetical protein CY35_02G028800 [Sphagnum magellanicum]
MAGEGGHMPPVSAAAATGGQQQQAPSMTTPSSSAAAGLPPVASSGPMSALSAVTTPAAAASQLQQQQQHLSYQMQQFNQNQAKTQQQQQAARVQYAQSSQLQVPASQQLMAPTQVAGNPLSRSGSGQRLSHMPQQQQQHYNTQFLSSSSVATSGVSSQTMLMAQQRAAAAGQAQLQQQQQRPSSVLQPVQSRPGIYGLQQQQPQQQLAPGSYAHHLNPAQSTGGVVARPAAVQQGTPQYGVQSQLSLPQQHAMQARQKQVQGQMQPPTPFQTTAPSPVQQAMAMGRPGAGLASPQQQQQNQQQQRLTQQLQQQNNPSRPSSQPQQTALSNLSKVPSSSVGGAALQMQGLVVPGAQQSQQATWQPKPTGYQQQHQTQLPQQRAQVIGSSNQQRPATPTISTTPQSSTTAQQPTSNMPSAAVTSITQPPDYSTGHILGKRSIQELVAQVDPQEHLDPDLEDVLLEIADDFIDSVTSFACTLAKHRKSSVLEAKDVLLHLEHNWHITVPGFGSEEYRPYKRQSISETHKQRLALVRKSAAAAGQPGTESKGAIAAAGAPVTNPSGTVSTPNKAALSSVAAASLASPMASAGLPRVPRI